MRLVEVLARLGQRSQPLDLTDTNAIRAFVDELPATIRGVAGGNTACVEVRIDESLWIIDFGSGLRPLGDELLKGSFGRGQGHANLLLSHFHYDHIQGWPFFKPLYIKGNSFDIYSRHAGTQQLLHQQQQAPFFPPEAWNDMAATKRFHRLPAQPIKLGDSPVCVSTLELDHPSSAYAFRLDSAKSSVVYASDGAYTLPGDDNSEAALRTIEFFREADLIIFDSQFSFLESQQKRAWGHSSAVVGVQLARLAQAKRLALFHHDPGASDAHLDTLLQAASDAAQGELDVFMAREGLEIEL